MNMTKGMRERLGGKIEISKEVSVRICIRSKAQYNIICFGTGNDKKIAPNRYIIHKQQTSSLKNEIRYSDENGVSVFRLNISEMPQQIRRLSFAAAVGDDSMNNISELKAEVVQNGRTAYSIDLSGSNFSSEKAIIIFEIYYKDEWRISASLNGMNGGLPALLAEYGCHQLPVSAPSVQNTVSGKNETELTNKLMGKINLSKDKIKLEKHVINLSKCVADISKKNGVDLGSMRAKVVAAIDYSGSMVDLYHKGTVQRTLNKLIPLGLTFDDNGSIDVFLFQNDFRKLEDLNLSNYENYVEKVVNNSGYSMGGTNYAPVLRTIIYGGTQRIKKFLGFIKNEEYIPPVVDDGDPTFVLFITDGENYDIAQTNDVVFSSSEKNVFIQFIGIGNRKFENLIKLDNMPGRKRDNTGFSRMASLERVSDDELYKAVLEQFSLWLRGLQ